MGVKLPWIVGIHRWIVVVVVMLAITMTMITRRLLPLLPLLPLPPLLRPLLFPQQMAMQYQCIPHSSPLFFHVEDGTKQD